MRHLHKLGELRYAVDQIRHRVRKPIGWPGILVTARTHKLGSDPGCASEQLLFTPRGLYGRRLPTQDYDWNVSWWAGSQWGWSAVRSSGEDCARARDALHFLQRQVYAERGVWLN